MSTQKPFTYQPEDLERLLRTKEFSGLLPEERAFVLQHVSNEKEFNELKMLLGHIESSDHEMQDPPAAVWKNLKKEFNQQKSSRFKVWLNFLFPPLPKWSGFRTVSFSLFGMAAVVGAIVWFIPSENNSNQLASVQENSNSNSIPNTTNDTVSENLEFKVNSEQHAELNLVSGRYVIPVVREVEHVHEAPYVDEVNLDDVLPTSNPSDAKEEIIMDFENAKPQSNNDNSPIVTSGNLNNSEKIIQQANSEQGNIHVADSVKIQPKKKKKTTPKKK